MFLFYQKIFHSVSQHTHFLVVGYLFNCAIGVLAMYLVY